MTDIFAITEYKGRLLSFLIEDGKVADIDVYEDESFVGNIYVAVVTNIVEGIGAVFADISKDVTVYVDLGEFSKSPKKGELITVQIVKDSYMKKKAVATTVLSVTTPYAVISTDRRVGVSKKIESEEKRNALKECFKRALGEKKYGGIIRTSAGKLSESELSDELNKGITELESIIHQSGYSKAHSCIYKVESAVYNSVLDLKSKRELKVVTDIKEVYDELITLDNVSLYTDDNMSLLSFYNLNTLMERLLGKRAYLKSGGFLVIERTEALYAIDVNSGKDIRASEREEFILKVNLEAAVEVCRQLRLRNLTGMIIVDFISMKDRNHNEQLINCLKYELSKDRVPATYVDMTGLGLVEITRKKLKKSLQEALS